MCLSCHPRAERVRASPNVVIVKVLHMMDEAAPSWWRLVEACEQRMITFMKMHADIMAKFWAGALVETHQVLSVFGDHPSQGALDTDLLSFCWPCGDGSLLVLNLTSDCIEALRLHSLDCNCQVCGVLHMRAQTDQLLSTEVWNTAWCTLLCAHPASRQTSAR